MRSERTLCCCRNIDGAGSVSRSNGPSRVSKFLTTLFRVIGAYILIPFAPGRVSHVLHVAHDYTPDCCLPSLARGYLRALLGANAVKNTALRFDYHAAALGIKMPSAARKG
jgi:hypothetical protein